MPFVIENCAQYVINAVRRDDRALVAQLRRAVVLLEGAHVDLCLCTSFLDVV